MEDRRRAPRPLEGSVWAGRLAMLFVFVALAVLAVVHRAGGGARVPGRSARCGAPVQHRSQPGDADRAGEGHWIELCVRDTGPGIPEAERERIFDEFHRLHGGEAEGHGLGLATSRRIARLLGGDITVDAAEGGGSEFRLRLPAAAA